MSGQRSSRAESTRQVIVGDCVDVMAAMPRDSVDAVVTDPPYGLGFMGKDWDRPDFMAGDSPMRRSAALDSVNAGASRQGGRQRAGADYLRRQARDARAFQEWCEAWASEALRVLKPGGHLLAFGGTRMAHRLATGIEDAGFEIRDTIAWMHGNGFPKSTTPAEGMGTALKPAHEPVTVARKALGGTVAATVAEHGTGALNIDACRIPGEVEPWGPRESSGRSGGIMGEKRPREAWEPSSDGRWPANVVLDDASAAQLDEQTGVLTSGKSAEGGHRRNTDKTRTVYGRFEGQTVEGDVLYGDSGGASRFFYVAKPDQAERHAGLGDTAGLFSPADAPDRNDHPTVKPIDLMRWLVRLVTPPGGVVLDPFTGSGTTGCAAALEGLSFIGIEREPAYASIARARLAHWSLGVADAA